MFLVKLGPSLFYCIAIMPENKAKPLAVARVSAWQATVLQRTTEVAPGVEKLVQNFHHCCLLESIYSNSQELLEFHVKVGCFCWWYSLSCRNLRSMKCIFSIQA